MNRGKKTDKRRLSEEERQLWQRVLVNTTPLHLKKSATSENPFLNDAGIKHTLPLTAGVQKGDPPKPFAGLPGTSAKLPTALPLTGLDRRTEQRLRRGRIDVDGTLDLHGMTQAHAHMALRGFLVAAQGRGDRLVLVITGKGSPPGVRYEAENMWGSGRGILRRLVPEWLSQPDFSSWVSGFRNAHQRHGGGGALYVRIRRKRG